MGLFLFFRKYLYHVQQYIQGSFAVEFSTTKLSYTKSRSFSDKEITVQAPACNIKQFIPLQISLSSLISVTQLRR